MDTEAFISKAKQIVLDNLLNPHFGVVELGKELGISRSELYKRIKSTEKKSVSQFIREIRLEEASKLLASQSYSISEIAYKVGFNSPTYFSTCFKEYYGYSPSDPKGISGPKQLLEKYNSKTWTVPFFVAIVLISGLLWLLNAVSSNSVESEISLGVLYFEHLGKSNETDYISKSIANEISNRLSNLGAFDVVQSSYQIDKDFRVKRIGNKLGVEYLLSGTIWTDERELKLNVKLIDAEKEHHLWGKSYEGSITDYTNIQEEVSENLVSIFKSLIIEKETFSNIANRTTNLKAFELYFDAVRLGELRNEESIAQAIEWLESAVQLDPNFAEAYAELSFLYGQLHYYGSLGLDERDKLMTYNIEKAMELAPESSEVLFAKSDYDRKHGNILQDSSKIISGFKEVLERDPKNHRSSYRLYLVYRTIGKYDLAHNYLEACLKLDPLNSLYNEVMARDLYWKKNEKDRALKIIQELRFRDNPSRGSIYLSAIMKADHPDSDYLSAFKELHQALQNERYTYDYLFWTKVLAEDLDILPLANKYIHLIQQRFPENPAYTYEPKFNLLLAEKRYDDAIDLTNIWVLNKWLNKGTAAANLAKLYYLKGEYIRSRSVLVDTFSELYEKIESGKYPIDHIRAYDIPPIRSLIEVLRKEGSNERATLFANYLCSYYKKQSQRIMLASKFDPLDCYYLQNDLENFLVVLNKLYFVQRNRFALFSHLSRSDYAAFEKNSQYKALFEKIKAETHKKRTEVIHFLKKEGDWESSWDDKMQ